MLKINVYLLYRLITYDYNTLKVKLSKLNKQSSSDLIN